MGQVRKELKWAEGGLIKSIIEQQVRTQSHISFFVAYTLCFLDIVSYTFSSISAKFV